MGFCFLNDTATTEIYTLSLHAALPIWIPGGRRVRGPGGVAGQGRGLRFARCVRARPGVVGQRFEPLSVGGPTPPRPASSEEHTSELQSLQYLVCLLLLVKKKPPRKFFL